MNKIGKIVLAFILTCLLLIIVVFLVQKHNQHDFFYEQITNQFKNSEVLQAEIGKIEKISDNPFDLPIQDESNPQNYESKYTITTNKGKYEVVVVIDDLSSKVIGYKINDRYIEEWYIYK